MNNRIIKFRAWDVEQQRMYYPISSLHTVNNDMGYPEVYQDFDVPDEGFAPTNGFMGDETVIQQFTGLKDKNGKEIYEGDIVFEYPDNRQTTLIKDNIYEVRDDLPRLPDKDIIIRSGQIVYSAPLFVLKYTKLTSTGATSGDLCFGGNYEVIGNIFENPELIP